MDSGGCWDHPDELPALGTQSVEFGLIRSCLGGEMLVLPDRLDVDDRGLHPNIGGPRRDWGT